MAAGNLPGLPLSVNDINVAFYGASNVKTLTGLGVDATMSLPIKVRNFAGLPYCKVVPDVTDFEWAFDDFGDSVEEPVVLTIVPDKTFCVYSAPTFMTYACDQTYNVLYIYPASLNSNETRSGRICICTTTGVYTTSFIDVTQFSAQ